MGWVLEPILGEWRGQPVWGTIQRHSYNAIIPPVFRKYYRVCVGPIILFCCIYPPNLKGQSVKIR